MPEGGGGVPADTFVTTGTHTGLVFTDPSVAIHADYGPLGSVAVSFPFFFPSLQLTQVCVLASQIGVVGCAAAQSA